MSVLNGKLLSGIHCNVRNSFLVPDSCRAMVRNTNRISADFTEDTIKKLLERRLLPLFLEKLEVVLGKYKN
jgi:hypothetical protein